MHSATSATTTRRDAQEINALEPANGKEVRQRRWTDLGLVLLVAFVPSIGSSFYHLFYPVDHNYTNAHVVAGVLQELTALTLFGVLFSRQTRRIGELGFSFNWVDLPKGLYLVIGCVLTGFLTSYALRSIWFLVTQRVLPVGAPSTFSASLWLLIPFLILNPFFEEILVRGYLMTEIIELRSSVGLAILVSLAVQTSYHLYYGIEGAAFVGGGLAILALYYAKTRQLMPVIVAHLLWDLVALVQAGRV